MSNQPLHVKYRPSTLDEIFGHASVVKALRKQLDSDTRPHAYLFTGGAGQGKTTLGRIIANYVECEPQNLIEMDAASNSGKDEMKALTKTASYTGFGASGVKVYLIDECHAISKAGWDTFLKTLEEPPAHVYFIFCTTEPAKVPKAIVTRCAHYNLDPLKRDDILDLLEFVCDEEELDVDDKILEVISRQCEGSARQALQMLSKADGVDDLNEFKELIKDSSDSNEVIDLARGLAYGKLDWAGAMKIVSSIKDQNPESIRITVINYCAACALNEKNSGKLQGLLAVMDAFSGTFNTSDKMAPVILAIGDLLLGD